VFEQLHFAHRDEVGQRGFGALILVHAVGVQSIAATARLRIIERKAEIVAAQEPLEGDAGLFVPEGIVGGAIGLEARRDGAVGLDRLLVKLRG
jgi:hypothetical protein